MSRYDETNRKAFELVSTLARMTTPFDGVDKANENAMEDATDDITNDQEGEDAATLWEMIEAARTIVKARDAEAQD